MQHLPTMELLPAKHLGNVRRRPSGATVPLAQDAAVRLKERGGRAMTVGVLFDTAQPNFNLAQWTVWRKAAPESVTGRVGPHEFRAFVRLPPCASVCTCLRACLCCLHASCSLHAGSLLVSATAGGIKRPGWRTDHCLRDLPSNNGGQAVPHGASRRHARVPPGVKCDQPQ